MIVVVLDPERERPGECGKGHWDFGLESDRQRTVIPKGMGCGREMGLKGGNYTRIRQAFKSQIQETQLKISMVCVSTGLCSICRDQEATSGL